MVRSLDLNFAIEKAYKKTIFNSIFSLTNDFKAQVLTLTYVNHRDISLCLINFCRHALINEKFQFLSQFHGIKMSNILTIFDIV